MLEYAKSKSKTFLVLFFFSFLCLRLPLVLASMTPCLSSLKKRVIIPGNVVTL